MLILTYNAFIDRTHINANMVIAYMDNSVQYMHINIH